MTSNFKTKDTFIQPFKRILVYLRPYDLFCKVRFDKGIKAKIYLNYKVQIQKKINNKKIKLRYRSKVHLTQTL